MREVFISYAWKGESEEIANGLERAFQSAGIRLVRDKTDLGYRGLIKQFMQEIGRGKCVIAIISDKYLRSKNCMYELLEISKNGDFLDRIFPVVLDDVRIYDAIDRLEYIKYWDGKIATLKEAIKEVDPINLQGITEEINLFVEIRNRIAGLVDILQGMNNLTAEIHRDSNFEEVVSSIARQLEEDGNLSSESNKTSPNTNIGIYAPNVRGSNLISGENISGNTFIGTQNNYNSGQSSGNSGAIEIWRQKLGYLQQQEAIASNPAVKFELSQQIAECLRKIQELGG
ncbi:toll/interleukin-1 receptor domain-containing protein [Pannus brasiliensis CCIBt3594]|uniref:Toll/interleukin-1 receptor domain-containing protein n=1 Tax=Pannus brasiliensis CCIBt3594 TaxID=1427578 RepID=A0AAW9QZ68_9CHRO